MRYVIRHGAWSSLHFRRVDQAMGGMIRWCAGLADACHFTDRAAAEFWNRQLDLMGVVVEVMA